MNNFFEIASDELTQDSFICWLLSNIDDKDLGNISKKFLSFLCDEKFGESKVKITKITRQFKHIDIIVDYFVDDDPRLLIIEDKTNSTMHGTQLTDYINEVEGWDSKETKKRIVHFVYYKTGYVENWEKNELKKIRLIDIKEIYDFFSNLESSSEIFNQYKNNIVKMYKDRNEDSDRPLDSWTFDNWRYYFDKFLKDKYESKINWRLVTYHGKYLSALIYFKDSDKYEHTTCLEIIFRKENTINATIHPVATRTETNSWKRDKNESICKTIDDAKLNESFKHYSRNQTVAASERKINPSNLQEAENMFCKWIDDYLADFERFNTK